MKLFHPLWHTGDQYKYNPQHYAPAVEIFRQLANELVFAANTLWEILIDEVGKVIPSVDDDYSKLSIGFQHLANTPTPYASGYAATPGSALYSPPDDKK